MKVYPIQAVIPAVRQMFATGTRGVLSAPPGAGKSTVLPLALLEHPWLAGRKIIMLEPRRLAAYTVAQRLAENLGEEVGVTVGYRMRLDRCVGPRTRIEVVTEGVLTRFLQHDPGLEGVGAVIFDEFHERSLQADLALALTLDVQQNLRDDLRLLVMSATVDTAAVAALLGDCPVVVSPGRCFDVQTVYRTTDIPRPLEDLVADTVAHAAAHEPGSILVFLPGETVIRRVEARLKQIFTVPGIAVLPLYGKLSREAQHRAIAPCPPGQRKIVLATSIAETSLTIEGVRLVVDSGLTRAPVFSPVTGMSRLETVRIAKASADQRRGRAGRLEDGVCYRLWTEKEQRQLADYALPEIFNADLAPLVLELAAWGVTTPGQLSWPDPPPEAHWHGAVALLRDFGAVDAAGKITPYGRTLADLGLHPRIGHLLRRGCDLGWGWTACLTAAVLTESDTRRLPSPDLSEAVAAAAHSHEFERERRLAGILAGRLGLRRSEVDSSRCGLLAALAYPDRIGKKRDRDGQYLLSCGRGAGFRTPVALGREKYLAAAELDAGEKEAEIRLAAALSEAELRQYFAALLRRGGGIVVDRDKMTVRCLERLSLGAVVVEEKISSAPDPATVHAAVIDFLRHDGMAVIPWPESAVKWRERIAFLRRYDVDGNWPEWSDETLLETLEQWLEPFLPAKLKKDFLTAVDWTGALLGMLDWSQRARADKLAPERITVPSGSRLRVAYDGERPVLAVKLQEMFGSAETPQVLGGKMPVLLHLLSPAGRPVQVTDDIGRFWRESYGYVKNELKGRYPKHPWPDDPMSAVPTARAKPRRR
ncbi:MAG: ATP-dependent helicase HrpB [Victivallales bacterium]|nr:ATP-dependent helicase HrpB [Victivallales bacterium]